MSSRDDSPTHQAPQPGTSFRPGPQHISIVAGALAAGIGAMVLVGWAINNEVLTSIAPRFIAMLPSTATGMLAAGIAILLLRRPDRDHCLILGRLLSVYVIVLGALSFASRMAGAEIGYVGRLFQDRVALHPYRPVGLMATNSALTFMLVGLALILIGLDNVRARLLGRVLATVGGAIATVAMLGHLFGAPALYAFDRAAGMALLTAVSFLGVQIGLLFLRPADPGVSLLTGDDLAAKVTRRLLPLTVIVPVALGLLWLEGRE